MKPETIDEMSAFLPDFLPFLYFEDRESPWLLNRLLPAPARVAAIRRAPFGKLLERPCVRPVVARCGSGVLDPQHLLAAAEPEAALAPDAVPVREKAARAGLNAALETPLHECSLSFTRWGRAGDSGDWRWFQTSRAGQNLVVQLNFPETHDAALAWFLGHKARRAFECWSHPVSTSGPITMAWVRIDLDIADGEALIEEVQSDWFRLARWTGSGRRSLVGLDGAVRGRIREYIAAEMWRYEAIWQEAVLLAALWFIRCRVGIRRIYMHRPATGARLKGIRHTLPPASIYSDLPQRFCFAPTRGAPKFLMRDRGKAVRNLRRKGKPVFWLLDL